MRVVVSYDITDDAIRRHVGKILGSGYISHQPSIATESGHAVI
jgi:CRISPR/Cas system-associated endoribonuclease Cas2